MTIFGWDMSHFDAPSIGDALSEGITFITHKAGGDANDAELGAWWSGVKGLPPGRVLLGAYWVLYPGNPSGRADAFISRLDSQCPGWRDRPFILQADCEKWNGDASTVPSKSEIQAFCNRLKARMPKLRPIAYAPEWVYGNSLDGLGYPLWASRYVNGTGGFKSLYPGDSSSKWQPYSNQTPAILQYTSSATIGGQTTCDANAFRGTLAQLTALVAPGWTEDMALTDDDLDKIEGKILGLLRSADGKRAVGQGVFEYDPGYVDSSDHSKGVWPGISDSTYPQTGSNNGTVGLGTAISSLLSRQQAYGEADKVAAAALLAAITAGETVDAVAVATALAPLLAPMLVGLTPGQIEQALTNVLVHGTEGN